MAAASPIRITASAGDVDAIFSQQLALARSPKVRAQMREIPKESYFPAQEERRKVTQVKVGVVPPTPPPSPIVMPRKLKGYACGKTQRMCYKIL